MHIHSAVREWVWRTRRKQESITRAQKEKERPIMNSDIIFLPTLPYLYPATRDYRPAIGLALRPLFSRNKRYFIHHITSQLCLYTLTTLHITSQLYSAPTMESTTSPTKVTHSYGAVWHAHRKMKDPTVVTEIRQLIILLRKYDRQSKQDKVYIIDVQSKQDKVYRLWLKMNAIGSHLLIISAFQSLSSLVSIYI